MRILVYSDSSYVLDLFKMCTTEGIEVEHISYNRINSMSLTSCDDVYVIDSAYVDELDKAYLDILKALNVEVILLVSELNKLHQFMGFNIVEYFYNNVSFTKLSSCIVRLYNKKKKLKKFQDRRITNKFIVRNKSEAFVIDNDSIIYIIASNRVLHVCTDDKTYVCDDFLDRVLQGLPDHFFKVSDSILVNFKKVKAIEKISPIQYRLKFHREDDCVFLTDYMLNNCTGNELRNSRQRYVAETIMECIN